jgi:hypothetical protein
MDALTSYLGAGAGLTVEAGKTCAADAVVVTVQQGTGRGRRLYGVGRAVCVGGGPVFGGTVEFMRRRRRRGDLGRRSRAQQRSY